MVLFDAEGQLGMDPLGKLWEGLSLFLGGWSLCFFRLLETSKRPNIEERGLLWVVKNQGFGGLI